MAGSASLAASGSWQRQAHGGVGGMAALGARQRQAHAWRRQALGSVGRLAAQPAASGAWAAAASGSLGALEVLGRPPRQAAWRRQARFFSPKHAIAAIGCLPFVVIIVNQNAAALELIADRVSRVVVLDAARLLPRADLRFDVRGAQRIGRRCRSAVRHGCCRLSGQRQRGRNRKKRPIVWRKGRPKILVTGVRQVCNQP